MFLVRREVLKRVIWVPAALGQEHNIVQSETTTSAGGVSTGFSITGEINLEPEGILGILVPRLQWDPSDHCQCGGALLSE